MLTSCPYCGVGPVPGTRSIYLRPEDVLNMGRVLSSEFGLLSFTTCAGSVCCGCRISFSSVAHDGSVGRPAIKATEVGKDQTIDCKKILREAGTVVGTDGVGIFACGAVSGRRCGCCCCCCLGGDQSGVKAGTTTVCWQNRYKMIQIRHCRKH